MARHSINMVLERRENFLAFIIALEAGAERGSRGDGYTMTQK